MLAVHRAALWDSEHPDEPADDAMREDLRAYFARVLAGTDVVAWLAVDDGEPVGTVRSCCTSPRHERPASRRALYAALGFSPLEHLALKLR